MKLNYKRTTLIGLAFMSILAFWQFYDQVIPYILENVFGQSTLRTNAIMAICSARSPTGRIPVSAAARPMCSTAPSPPRF